jgi:hypothetical protein
VKVCSELAWTNYYLLVPVIVFNIMNLSSCTVASGERGVD